MAKQKEIGARALEVAEHAVAAVVFQTLHKAATEASWNVAEHLLRHGVVDREQVAAYVARAFQEHV